jgi:hypothetical protein
MLLFCQFFPNETHKQLCKCGSFYVTEACHTSFKSEMSPYSKEQFCNAVLKLAKAGLFKKFVIFEILRRYTKMSKTKKSRNSSEMMMMISSTLHSV